MNKDQLTIPSHIAEKMLKLAKTGFPYEICGILSGKFLEVLTLWELETKYRRRNTFFVEEHTVEAVLKEIEEKHEEVLAIFHSHPTAAAIPSSMDIIHHPDPNVLMIIISLKDDQNPIKCFQINKSSSKEFPYIIT